MVTSAPRAGLVSSRVTIGFNKTATECLDRLADWLGQTKTDVTNKAVTLYELIESRKREGWQVAFTRTRKDGSTEVQPIHII